MPPADPPTPNTTIQNAETLYRRGEYTAAAELLAPITTDPSALRILGLCRLRLGAPTEALDLLSSAYTIAPGDPWTRLHYGIGLQATGRHAEAIPLFRACQSMLPADPAPWLNLATSLLALNDIPAAIAAARKGRLRAPALPQSHYTLGTALLAGDFLDRAAESFHTATKLSPAFAAAWINLGVAHYRRGDIADAEAAMRTALRVDPGNQAAATNLSTFLRLTGNMEAADSLLQSIMIRHPGAAPARINQAANLLQEDRAEEALALLPGPPPTDPRTRQHWQLQQILALIVLKRLAEARDMLAALGTVQPALVSLLQWRLTLLALAEGDTAQAEQHATAMASTLNTMPSTLPEHRIMGHYDLAKFWSRLAQPDQAFPHWARGHQQLARFQPFSRTAYAEFVDATIATFTAERLAQGPRANNDDPTPVFIVGMPRSGTTLVEQILSAHAEVFGAGERHALGHAFDQLGGATETAAAVQRVAAQNNETLNTVSEQYLTELHLLDPAARRIVDKMPGNFRHLGLAALLLPGARVIACDRDPRDIGLSIFTYRFYGVHAYANDLADLGWYIGQQRRLMAHWRAVLPIPVMTVRLRDLVENFHPTLRAMLDFLGLPYDPDCERFHEIQRPVRTVSRAQVREPINARGLGRWREYEHHLGPLIASLRDSGSLDETEA